MQILQKKNESETDELHNTLSTRNEEGVKEFLAKKFPQEFCAITQDINNYRALITHVFKGREDESVIKEIDSNKVFGFMFNFFLQDRKISGFILKYAEATKEFISKEEYEELLGFANIIKAGTHNEEFIDHNYIFPFYDINIKSIMQFISILDRINDFISSDEFLLLSEEKISLLHEITKKMSDIIDKDDKHECLEIYKKAKKIYEKIYNSQAEYAYKKATNLIHSTEFKQIDEIIPSKGSILSPIDSHVEPYILFPLSRTNALQLPEMFRSFVEKITLLEKEGATDKIFDKELVDLIKKIKSLLNIIYGNLNTDVKNESLITIGDKSFYLKDMKDCITKIYYEFEQLNNLVSMKFTDLRTDSQKSHSKDLIAGWKIIPETTNSQ